MAPIDFNPGNGNVITGDLAATVTDGGGVNPTNIIRRTDSWTLDADWHIQGGLVAMMAGTWRLSAFLELMGPGNDFVLPIPAAIGDVDIATGGVPVPPNRIDYTATVNFAAGAGSPPAAGVYRLVVVLSSLTAGGLPGAFAAFVDGGLLQFYD